MGVDNCLLVLVTEATLEASDKPTFDAKIDAAMRCAKNHWLVTNKDDRFRGAIAAIYELADEPTKARIMAEVDDMRNLSALISGIPIDVSQIKPSKNPLGLLRRWNEIK
jgi:hypothetical protein